MKCAAALLEYGANPLYYIDYTKYLKEWVKYIHDENKIQEMKDSRDFEKMAQNFQIITQMWRNFVSAWNEEKKTSIGLKKYKKNQRGFYYTVQPSCPYWLALDIKLNTIDQKQLNTIDQKQPNGQKNDKRVETYKRLSKFQEFGKEGEYRINELRICSYRALDEKIYKKIAFEWDIDELTKERTFNNPEVKKGVPLVDRARLLKLFNKEKSVIRLRKNFSSCIWFCYCSYFAILFFLTILVGHNFVGTDTTDVYMFKQNVSLILNYILFLLKKNLTCLTFLLCFQLKTTM